jgi:hypothetical protein
MSGIFLGIAGNLSNRCVAGREGDAHRDWNCESRQRSKKASTRRHVSSPFHRNGLPGNGPLQVHFHQL